jgi:hypothetical protein
MFVLAMSLTLALVNYSIFPIWILFRGVFGSPMAGAWLVFTQETHLDLALSLAFPSAGLAGITLVELNWVRSLRSRGESGDLPHAALIAAIVPGVVYFASGLILGNVYMPPPVAFFILREAIVSMAAVATGFYLLWLAVSLGSTWGLPAAKIAFAAGVLSVGLEAMARGLYVFGFPSLWVSGMSVSSSFVGLASLGVWIVVFSRILVIMPRKETGDSGDIPANPSQSDGVTSVGP